MSNALEKSIKPEHNAESQAAQSVESGEAPPQRLSQTQKLSWITTNQIRKIEYEKLIRTAESPLHLHGLYGMFRTKAAFIKTSNNIQALPGCEDFTFPPIHAMCQR